MGPEHLTKGKEIVRKQAMKIYRFPSQTEWDEICSRPHIDTETLRETVGNILKDVKLRGDTAVKEYEQKFDRATLDHLQVSADEIEVAAAMVSPELKAAIEMAHDNIACFHNAQLFSSKDIQTQPGVVCWQKSVAIESVGLYIPGGTAPLFSTVLMLATPARIAGCSQIVLCTPPSPDGKVNPAILYAAKVAGVSHIYKIGGVQAIGAMAYGTPTVPKVSKIFGPGNQYVMQAKQQVAMGDVAIDMPAGPSEVCVIADKSARADFVAADLLSQAEHGADSQVVFITTDEALIAKVQKEIDAQLALLPRRSIAQAALDNSRIILVGNTDEAMNLSNYYAPEHLIIQTEDCPELAKKVRNAGSVFLGSYAPESAGDYASGTNHTLPTHGHAKAYSGVNLDSFCRKITFQHLTQQGAAIIGPAVIEMAAAEQLTAHRNAMLLRLGKDISAK